MSGPLPSELRATALRVGKVEVRVRHSGMYQRIDFKVEREPFPLGPVPYLHADREIDQPELLRVASELDLPVKSKTGHKIFAPGKSARDYAGL